MSIITFGFHYSTDNSNLLKQFKARVSRQILVLLFSNSLFGKCSNLQKCWKTSTMNIQVYFVYIHQFAAFVFPLSFSLPLILSQTT